MTDHTPTPWAIVGHGSSTQIVEATREHMRVCFMTTDGKPRTNAEFIVKAVNNHDALVDMLTKLRRLDWPYDDGMSDLRKKVDDLLASVGGPST